jgi:hypothetical protein
MFLDFTYFLIRSLETYVSILETCISNLETYISSLRKTFPLKWRMKTRQYDFFWR